MIWLVLPLLTLIVRHPGVGGGGRRRKEEDVVRQGKSGW